MTHIATCSICGREWGYDPRINPASAVRCCGRSLEDSYLEPEPIPQPPEPTRSADVHPLTERQREAWRRLHRYPLEHQDDWDIETAKLWYVEWDRSLGAIGCQCRKHWHDIIKQNQPDFTSSQAFFSWSVARHNDVNDNLSKPRVSIAEALEIHA